MEENSIKTIIFSTLVSVVIIHGVVEKIIIVDQSDHPSDFGGNYYVKNISDTTDTAMSFSLLPSIIELK